MGDPWIPQLWAGGRPWDLRDVLAAELLGGTVIRPRYTP